MTPGRPRDIRPENFFFGQIFIHETFSQSKLFGDLFPPRQFQPDLVFFFLKQEVELPK